MNSVPALISYTDREKRFQFTNKAYEDLLGRSLGELRGVRVEEVLGDSAYRVAKPHIEKALAGQRCRFENVIGNHKGKQRIIDVSYVPDFDEAGTVNGFIALVVDITERKRADLVLRRQALVLEQMSDAVIVTDPEGKIIDWNLGAERMFGYAKDEVLGETPGVLHRPTEAELLAAKIIEGMNRHGRWVGEITFIRKDGTVGICETLVVPFYDEQGEQVATIGVNRDITERKRAENALRAAHDTLEQRVRERTVELEREIAERKGAEEALQDNEQALQDRIEQLEEAQCRLAQQGVDLVRLADDLRFARDGARAADRAKSEFLAAMSHELRTPLNAIIGFSQIIKDETFGPVGSPKYREYTNDILESGQHLLGLINDILDLSKIECGKDELHEDKIEIPEIIRSALMLVGQRAEQGGIKLELELPDQLPALRADERKLKQILVNLLSNAIKFTDAGGEVALWAWCRMGSGHVFQIIDTGIGMAPGDIPKALSRFGQVDGDLDRQYEGTGLGLPLTKALVEQHGGVLDLQSQVGVGTTVTVRFPAERIVASLDNADSFDIEDRAAS